MIKNLCIFFILGCQGGDVENIYFMWINA